MRVNWRSLGMPEQSRLRDLWERKDIEAAAGGYTFGLEPHSSGLYKLTASR